MLLYIFPNIVFFGKAEDLFLPKISGVGAGGVCFGGPSVRYVFPNDALVGETASSLRNMVLETSFSLTGVCSGAGVGSVSLASEFQRPLWLFFLSVDVSHAWSHKGIATCSSPTDLSGDLNKDAVLVYV